MRTHLVQLVASVRGAGLLTGHEGDLPLLGVLEDSTALLHSTLHQSPHAPHLTLNLSPRRRPQPGPPSDT